MISRTPISRSLKSLVSLAILMVTTLTFVACNSEPEMERSSATTKYAPAADTDSTNSSVSQDSSEKPSTNDGQASTSAPVTQPPALSNDEIDTTKVPEGNVKELLAFIDKLSKQPPRGATEKEAIANLTKTHQTINETATKLLSMETSDEEREQAIQAKLQSLAIMGRFGVENIEEELLAFAETLTIPFASISKVTSI